MTRLLGFILAIVGVTHVDDASAGYQRLGWAAFAFGLALLALALWDSHHERRLP